MSASQTDPSSYEDYLAAIAALCSLPQELEAQIRHAEEHGRSQLRDAAQARCGCEKEWERRLSRAGHVEQAARRLLAGRNVSVEDPGPEAECPDVGDATEVDKCLRGLEADLRALEQEWKALDAAPSEHAPRLPETQPLTPPQSTEHATTPTTTPSSGGGHLSKLVLAIAAAVVITFVIIKFMM